MDRPAENGAAVNTARHRSFSEADLRRSKSVMKFIARGLALCGLLSVADAQEFPLWEQLLSHYGGKTDETSVPSMKMGNHMQMSLKGTPHPGDEQRAQAIVVAARAVLM